MDIEQVKKDIRLEKTALGIELGSTRIKAVLIGSDHAPIASGSHDWENRLENGIWTYRLEDAWAGIQDCYRKLCEKVEKTYGEKLTGFAAIGFSGMMHGYLPFDREGNLLTPFRTWRNTMTEEAANQLTELFGFNIPQRWSIAHLQQAILNQEDHVSKIDHLTTLAGYIHWKLTGVKALGVGEASGMFPIGDDGDYNQEMLDKFDALHAAKGFPWKIRELLPKVLTAGEDAGCLTEEGALLLDPTGTLKPGIPLCPPEGDAGTGMTATNAVAVRTGNVSAGTSIFSMVVLEHQLSKVYPEIDIVTTPTGKPVAMVHCNNCTSDINAWAEMLIGFAKRIGVSCTMPQALDAIFFAALDGKEDCAGVRTINYFSGEPVTGLAEGRPLLMRDPDADFSFENLSRAHLYGAVATLKIGMDILTEQEKVSIDTLMGHGGFFKAEGVGQKLMAGALSTPVSVMETAGEGGPWGIALLAAYRVWAENGETLEDYLAKRVFAGSKSTTVLPQGKDQTGFSEYMKGFYKALEVEKAAVHYFPNN